MKKYLYLSAFLLLGSFGISTQVHANSNVYRLYNMNTGEHLYTTNATEKQQLIKVGWSNEGIGWVAPSTGTPVYRLYNSNVRGGDHYYTTSSYERNQLMAAGWHYDGSFWKSSGNIPVLVAYNAHAISGAHNFTTSAYEQNQLLASGWQYGQAAWQAVGYGRNATPSEQLESHLSRIQEIFNSTPHLMAAEYLDLATGRYVVKNGNNFNVSASTYKLFIARFVIQLIDSGQLSWNSSCPVGGTIRAGFYDMIHNSGNDFPIYIINRYGKPNIDSWLKGQGYQGIFNNPNEATTTATDLTAVLKYLWNHQSDSNISYLIGLMQGQIYRSGIPQGTGILTADKVGFLWDIRNDAGIVYNSHPYLLVLMTNNQSDFSLIQSVARQVQQTLSH